MTKNIEFDEKLTYKSLKLNEPEEDKCKRNDTHVYHSQTPTEQSQRENLKSSKGQVSLHTQIKI